MMVIIIMIIIIMIMIIMIMIMIIMILIPFTIFENCELKNDGLVSPSPLMVSRNRFTLNGASLPNKP
jgi:hypothetical protein